MPSARATHCAASALVAALLDGPERRLEEVARTRSSVHYETGDVQVPVLTLATPESVRLPATVVARTLPSGEPLSVSRGGLRQGLSCWRVARWWAPERPTGLRPPVVEALSLLSRDVPAVGVPLPEPSYDGLRPAELLGQGPGLTPSGDDLLAGALVAAHATADPRFGTWRSETLQALSTIRTTAVSRALLHHACEGYATPELAGFLRSVCGSRQVPGAAERLLAVGHTSGAALMHGVLHTLSTCRARGAA